MATKSMIRIPVLREKVIDLHAQGKTNAEIAEALGVGVNAVQKWIRNDLGLKPNRVPRTPIVNQERRERKLERIRLTKYYTRLGLSANEIAIHLGVARDTVVGYRRDGGVSQTLKPRWSAEEVEQARRLLEDGASYVDVAETLGRSTTYIRHKLPGYGWSAQQAGQMGYLVQKYGKFIR
jgi:transposase